MPLTQRFASMLRRHASKIETRLPIQAACCRQAALHIQQLQARVDAIACPWMPMRTAPTDGTVVMVLVDGSDIPRAVRTPVPEIDGPRYWMHCPVDPDA